MPCRLCDSELICTLYRRDGCTFYQCQKCGLIFSEHLPSSQELLSWYSVVRPAQEKSQNLSLSYHTRKSLQARANNYLKIIRRFAAPGSDHRLLDFGCGRGYFLTVAKNQGYDGYGIEINPLHAQHARQSGVNVFNETLAESDFEPNFFDIIVVSHVIEHLEDPFIKMEEVIRFLRSNGILLIGVPNVDGLWHRIYGADWIWTNVKEHIYQFPLDTLDFLMDKLSMKIIFSKTFSGHNAGIFPHKIQNNIQSQATSSSKRRELDKAILRLKHSQIIQLTSNLVFSTINRLLALNNMGDDLVIIARKQ